MYRCSPYSHVRLLNSTVMETLIFGLFLVLFVPGTAGVISCTGMYWDSLHGVWKFTTYYCDGTCCDTYMYEDKCCSSSSSILAVKHVSTQLIWIVVGVTGGLIVFCAIIGVASYFLCKTTKRAARSGTVHPSRNPNTQTTSFGPGIVQPPAYTTAVPPPPAYYPPVSPTAPPDKWGHHPTPGPPPIEPVSEDTVVPTGSEPAEAVSSAAPRSTFA